MDCRRYLCRGIGVFIWGMISVLFNTIAVIGVVSTLLGRKLVPKMSEYLYRNFGNLFYLKPITGDLKLYEKKN